MITGLFKRSAFYFIFLLLAKVIMTVVFILLARALQPEQFGQLTLFITLLTLASVIGDAGLNQWYQKYTKPEEVESNLHKVLSIRTVTQVITLITAGLGLVILDSPSTLFSIIFLATLIPEGYLSVLDGHYLFKGESYKVALKQGFRGILLLISIFLLRDTLTIESTLIIYFLVTMLTILLYVPWKTLKGFSWLGRTDSTQILRQSSPYLILITTSFAYARGDALIVRSLLTSAALGIYGAAYRYLEGISMLPTALAHNLFPLTAKNGTITQKQAAHITMIMTLLGIGVALGLWLAAPLLTTTILGPAYSDAIPLVRIFALVACLFFINAPLSTIVQSSDLIQKFLPFGIANTILNVILNLLLIPQFGLQAAAWTMVITELTGMCINLYFVAKIYTAKSTITVAKTELTQS